MPLRQFDIAGELLDGSNPRSPRAGASAAPTIHGRRKPNQCKPGSRPTAAPRTRRSLLLTHRVQKGFANLLVAWRWPGPGAIPGQAGPRYGEGNRANNHQPAL